MSIFDFTIGLVAPYNCLGCETEGSLLCRRCQVCLPAPPPAPQDAKYLKSVESFTAYTGTAKNLVWMLKSNGAKTAARQMAGLMTALVPAPDYKLMPAPTSPDHARQRGYDQAKLLTRFLSRYTGLPYIDSLGRAGKIHQIGASRRQRLRQLDGAFYVKKPGLVAGAKIILVDDVVTTGATLDTAAETLLAGGALEVRALAFAQTP